MKNIRPTILIGLLALLVLDGCAGRRARRAAEEQQAAAATAEATPDPGDMAAGEEAADEPSVAEAAAPPPAPDTQVAPSAPGSRDGYVLNELNFEIKKMGADVKHLASELRDLQAKSTMWANPLTIYSKEIILDNGSTIFGKIIYQDEKILKIETLIGYLIVERPSVVRIVENIPESPSAGVTPMGAAESLAVTPPPPANRIQQPVATVTRQAKAAQRARKSSFAPNIVLLGTVGETKDRSGNLKFTGEVKNVGGRRADFVKVNFVFRKDWSGATKALTTFVSGSFHTFESGITSDATVLPGASARFELYIPQSFGTFIGYSYTIDWEDYS